MGFDLTNEEVEALLSSLDADNSGAIDYVEFSRGKHGLGFRVRVFRVTLRT